MVKLKIENWKLKIENRLDCLYGTLSHVYVDGHLVKNCELDRCNLLEETAVLCIKSSNVLLR